MDGVRLDLTFVFDFFIFYFVKTFFFFYFDFEQKFTCENSSSNYFKLDSTFCNQNAVAAKIIMKNNNSSTSTSSISSTSSEAIDSGRDFKPLDKIRPAATGLVQRYTRNGKAYYKIFPELTYSSSILCALS